MGELKIYQTLEEKSSNFGVARIDTKIQFDDFFDERKSGNSIWRGMPDASHKLYTSLQRFWITNDLDKIEDNIFDYLESVIDGTLQWQNQTITNYYKHLTNQDPSFLAVLSLLRHHDSPSPLIDWTRNPKVALLFALMEHPNRHTSTIPNYFSVYEISPEYNWTKANIKQSTHDLLCGLLDPNVAAKDPEGYETLKDVLDGCLISTELSIQQKAHMLVNNLTYFRVSGGESNFGNVHIFQDVHGDPFDWNINNNLNIINQEGLFILNLNPSLPLEECLESQLKLLRNHERFSLKNRTDDHIENMIKRERSNFRCFDIHRGLGAYIKKRLKESLPPITKEYLFPNLYQLADDVTRQFLENESHRVKSFNPVQ